jgi:hypothetical protein
MHKFCIIFIHRFRTYVSCITSPLLSNLTMSIILFIAYLTTISQYIILVERRMIRELEML